MFSPILACFVAATLSSVLAAPPFANSCTLNFAGGARLPYDFCNVSLPLDDRVASLVGLMTPEEKCSSLDTSNPAIPRLGVPTLPGGEGLHGVACGCGAPFGASTGCPTSFPHATLLGAAFDKQLYSNVGSAIGLEARGLNNQDGTLLRRVV